LAIEMTSSGRETTLSRHVRVGAQQFDTGALVILQGGERCHLIHALHLPRLIVRDQLWPEIFGFSTDDRVGIPKSFVGAVCGMDSAQCDRLASLAKFRCDLVSARGIAGDD